MTDTLQLIKEREEELQLLYDRMDEDRKALYLESYILKGVSEQFKNKTIPGTVSVTMNKPAVYANAITSLLQKAKRQVVVEGLSPEKNRTIEQFLDDTQFTADQGLLKKRMGTLWGWICSHVAVRGPIGARWTWDADGNPICLPVDMRYCPFDDGWVANRTVRNFRQIEAEYENVKGVNKKLLPSSGKNIICRDYWDDKVNQVFVNEKLVLEQENIYKEPPFVLGFPQTGFMLLDEGYLEHMAESIFVFDRDLYSEWNRIVSIQQSLALKLLKPAYVQSKKTSGQAADDYPDVPGTMTAYNEGEIPTVLQTKDENNAFVRAQTTIGQHIQEGSISDTELGAAFGQQNASWLAGQEEIRLKVLTPRTQCLEQFCSQLDYLKIRTYQAHHFSKLPNLGKAGKQKTYTGEQLGDTETYSITHTYMSKSKRMEVANLTLGASMDGRIADEDLFRDIYQFDDPEGALDRKRAQRAEEADPVTFWYNQSARLIRIAKALTGEEKKQKNHEARMAADRMVVEIRIRNDRFQPQQPQPALERKPNSQGILALPSMMGDRGGSVKQLPQGVTTNAQ